MISWPFGCSFINCFSTRVLNSFETWVFEKVYIHWVLSCSCGILILLPHPQLLSCITQHRDWIVSNQCLSKFLNHMMIFIGAKKICKFLVSSSLSTFSPVKWKMLTLIFYFISENSEPAYRAMIKHFSLSFSCNPANKFFCVTTGYFKFMRN